MDALNNREWAVIIWVLIFVIFMLIRKNSKNRWAAFGSVFKSLFRKRIMTILLSIAIYVLVLLYGLYEIGLWTFSQLKVALVWLFSVGYLSVFKITRTNNYVKLFKELAMANLKIISILEFIIGLCVFNVFIEVFIVFVAAFLAVMTAAVEGNEKHLALRKIINGILTISGAGLLVLAIYMLVLNFGNFATKDNIADFYTPPILTIFYLPFLYLLVLIIRYERLFNRLSFFISDQKLVEYAKRYSIMKFGFRSSLLENWVNSLPNVNISSKAEIKSSVDKIFEVSSINKMSFRVSPSEGWSPHLAKEFLLEEGLVTGLYHPESPGIWCASSPFMNLGNELLPNNISYYINGDKDKVTSLKIVLNINSSESVKNAHHKLLLCVKILLEKANITEKISEIEDAILAGKNIKMQLNNIVLTLRKNLWRKNQGVGYDIKFIIEII